MSELINYVYVDRFEDMQKIIQLHQDHECNAIVTVLQNDIWKENNDQSQNEQIYNFISENRRMMILVLDCECTSNCIRFLFSFDMIFATERACLVKLDQKKDEMKLLLFMSERKKINTLLSLSELSSDSLLDHGIVVKLLSSTNLEENINKYMLLVLNERKQVQIEAIKKVINSYKSLVLKDVDIYREKIEFVEPEMEQFCKLALIRYKEKI